MPPTDTSATPTNTGDDKNDQAFLTLLSAQRQLLNRMNMEKMMQQERKLQQQQQHHFEMFQRQQQQQQQQHQQMLHQQQQQMPQHFSPYSSTLVPPILMTSRRYLPPPSQQQQAELAFTIASNTAPRIDSSEVVKHANDPLSLMNQSVSTARRSSLDCLHPTRRLSMGIGGGVGKDSFILEGGDMDDDDSDDWTNLKRTASKSDDSPDSANSDTSKAKRRRSSLGLLSALMEEDVVKAGPGSRRLSLASNLSKSMLDFSMRGGEPPDNMSFTMDDSYLAFMGQGPQPLLPQQSNTSDAKARQNAATPSLQLDPTIDLPTLKGMVERFAMAMDSTSKSQQDIHDWDRKMGLKRSHSKTMRLSMRSRKKLRAIMKKELTVLKSAEAKFK